MVKNNRLVATCIKILRSLLDKKLHYNEIIRQTSPDRTLVDKAIDVLERGQVIMEFKMNKHERKLQGIHSQAKMMQLTDLGQELIDMLGSLEQYKKAYFDLYNIVKEYFDKSGEKKYDISRVSRNDNRLGIVRKNVLRERGFTDEDIKFYNDSDDGTSWILARFGTATLEIIAARCVLRLYRFNLADVAKDILKNIFANAVSFRISVLLEDIKSYSISSGKIMDKEKVAEDLCGMPQFYFPAVINKQVMNAVLSYLSLAKPPKEFIDGRCQWIKERLEEHNKGIGLPERYKEHYMLLNFPKRILYLLDAYEAYQSKLH